MTIDNSGKTIKRPRGRPKKVVTALSQQLTSRHKKTIKSFLKNENKEFVNKVLTLFVTDLSKSLDNPDSYFFGTLDSVERNTSKKLMSHGIKKSSILLVESNKTTAKLHEKNGFAVHNGTLENFSSDDNDHVYSQKYQSWRTYGCLGWYFDTYGNIHTQKDGILNTINKSNLIDGSVLGFTFCRGHITTTKHNEDKSKFIRELSSVLKSKGFKMNIFFDYPYSGIYKYSPSRGMPMESFIGLIKRKKYCNSN